MKLIIALVILCSTLLISVQSYQCGRQAGGALCHDFQCCSTFGFCGTTSPWCGGGCQSMCWSGERSDHRCGANFNNPPCGQDRCCSIYGYCGSGNDYCGANCDYRCWTSFTRSPALRSNLTANAVTDILTESVFDDMFSHRKDCPSQDFYSYNALLVAAESFPSFATTGDISTRKRELAAFLALASQATTGKWSDVKDPHGWGLCHINGTTNGNKYTSRGPIQLAHIVNYGLAGQAIGVDLIKEPELVSTDAVVSFKTALWFWMAKHDNKPSCHDVMVNGNIPSNGVIADIFNSAPKLANSVTSSAGYYKRYCDMLGVPSLEFARIQMPLEA